MDVRDILGELGGGSGETKKKSVKKSATVKKPEGMARELWGLLSNDSSEVAPLVPTDSTGYKQEKAKLGRSRVRHWEWVNFKHPARKDDIQLYHWRRATADEAKKEYPFARFNKSIDLATYSDGEYQLHLQSAGVSGEPWTKAETDHLWQLCRRFDLRFVIIHDRWDRENFPNRSIQDLKERYYAISGILNKLHSSPGGSQKNYVYDAEHERKRTEQLEKLFKRTPEEVAEEQYLVAELKKIELQKREREKKTQDLQRIMHAVEGAGSSSDSGRRSERKHSRKKMLHVRPDLLAQESTGVKFPEFKQPGASLRSQRLKLPSSVGQKKVKALEQMLDKLQIDHSALPFEDVVAHFNELRQELVLLYELRVACTGAEYELHTLQLRYQQLAPGKIAPMTSPTRSESSASGQLSPDASRRVAEAIDVVGSGSGTPRKRRLAAIEQANVMKRVKGHKS